jgi:hypothetical protein
MTKEKIDNNVDLSQEEYQEERIKVESVLSKPEAGWSLFKIGDTEFWLSYLMDLPNDWLDTIIFAYEHDLPFVLKGECEPGFMYCNVNDLYVHIYYEEHHEASYEIYGTNIINVLINDFTKYIDEWADWGYIRYNEEELKEEKKRLQEKIERYHILRERRMKREKKEQRKKIQQFL